jgi:hypothetical protein
MRLDRVRKIIEGAPSDDGRDCDRYSATGKLGDQPFKPADEEIRVNRKGLAAPFAAERAVGCHPSLI